MTGRTLSCLRFLQTFRENICLKFAVGLFCCDKFEETSNKKVSDLSKLSKSNFNFRSINNDQNLKAVIIKYYYIVNCDVFSIANSKLLCTLDIKVKLSSENWAKIHDILSCWTLKSYLLVVKQLKLKE